MRTFLKIVAGALLAWGLLLLINPIVGSSLDRGVIYHEIGGKYSLGRIADALECAEHMNLRDTIAAIKEGQISPHELRALAREENGRVLWSRWFEWGLPPLLLGSVIGSLLCVPTRAS